VEDLKINSQYKSSSISQVTITGGNIKIQKAIYSGAAPYTTALSY